MSDEPTPPAGQAPPTPAGESKEGQGGGPTPPAGQPQGTPGGAAGTGNKVVPEKYDLKVPKGSLLEGADVEKIDTIARERGLSQEDAQKYLESHHELLSAQSDRREAEQEGMRQKWLADAKADPEIGGETFPQNVEFSKRAMERFGSEPLKQTLEESGLGNHPEVVRVFAKIGKAMADDTFVMGGNPGGEKKSAADVLYGGTK